ncbi:MAG: DUF4124 domain-containing protein [Gammaproteobacteria bacterium]
MNYKHKAMLIATMITTSYTATAQEVYENVDQQGVVEFSDQPSSGAKQIDVRPNVVNVAPVRGIGASSPAADTAAAEVPAGSAQPEIIHTGTTDYYDDIDKRRRLKKELIERKDTGEKIVQQPAHRSPAREAVRQGAGHR